MDTAMVSEELFEIGLLALTVGSIAVSFVMAHLSRSRSTLADPLAIYK